MDTDTFIKNLKVDRFKSIRHLEINCRRINLFIGKPNVGKSNILEAVALFAAQYSQNKNKLLSEFIRYESISNLFYDQDINFPIAVHSNIGEAYLKYLFKNNEFKIGVGFGNASALSKENIEQVAAIKAEYPETPIISPLFHFVNQAGKVVSGIVNRKDTPSPVKKYTFRSATAFSKEHDLFLTPPYGNNLFTILQTNSNLRKIIAGFFNEYGLEFVLDIQQRKLEIQKKVDGLIYKVPYHLIADTLQRIIFHLAAIYSNKDSVLLFEEPENHSYPPYIKLLAEKIIEATNNQFFITTHSPYLFNTIIANSAPEDVAVFVTTFKDYQTVVHQLSDEDLRELINYGVDVFFNLNAFTE